MSEEREINWRMMAPSTCWSAMSETAAGRCAKLRASGVAVLDLEGAEAKVVETVAAEIERAVAEDGCGAIVLGCAGMADLATEMTERFGLSIIDDVAAAIAFCEALNRAGIDNAPRRPPVAALP